jgi:transposase-like protein
VTRPGTTHNGVPTFRCRGCGRRFVAAPREGPISSGRKALVRRRLGERLSPRAIARVTGLSRSWVQGFVDTLYEDDTPWEPGPLKKARPANATGLGAFAP